MSSGRNRTMLRAVTLAMTLFGAATVAQADRGFGVPSGGPGVAPPRPVRIEGYWGRTQDDREVIGEITISPDGRERRRFGVTALQAYKPEEEGIHVFRHSSLSPITLLLRGEKAEVERFMTAPPDAKITAYGVYRAGPGNYIVMSVDVDQPDDRRGDASR